MPTAIAIRHVMFEDLGLLAGLLVRRGYVIGYLEAGVDMLSPCIADAADLLVVLGAPIGVYETETYPFLGPEIELIARRLANGRPMLGICLGAQLIARAAGCRVYPGKAKEIGYAPVRLSPAGMASPLGALGEAGGQVLHWHGDTFDLPDGATLLASTDITANQAFNIGRNVLALQFHIEVDPARLETWLIGHTVELAAVGISVGELRQAARQVGPAVARAGTAALDAWLAQIED
jgi:GMP synthase (glutamine-hydrolysing)